jgi:uncharacterized protein
MHGMKGIVLLSLQRFLRYTAATIMLFSTTMVIPSCGQTTSKKESTMNDTQKIRDGEFEMPDLTSLPADGGEKYNRLIFSSSPYLLQHADNPVDWYAWGDEAFARAVAENKPIFLSIGYSTCHWCHVMEHESFEDQSIADYLNEHFISIKLDREERPDIDNIYMTVCQAMTGSGGWPLTIFMTPAKQPFFAGTYFPREDNFGRPGFRKLLQHITDAWKNEQEKITQITGDIASMFQRTASMEKSQLDAATLEGAVQTFGTNYDSKLGGFGNAPKFPMAHTVSFLLQQYKATRNQDVLAMAEHTLHAMYEGGIYDHVGFGFCRYSTDAQWLVPHFEKMLYDNALLMMAYTEAYQITGKPFYRKVVEEIFTYINRDMTDARGGFYSAENADSEGEEGKFYVFTYEELLSILGKERGTRLAELYGASETGNFEHATNIVHIAMPIKDWATKHGMNGTEAAAEIEEARKELYAYRGKRIYPSLDDKVLTNWNGLMIAALAKAGFVLDDKDMIASARASADFMLSAMISKDGTLLHRYRNEEAGIDGFVDDYAFLVWGLIELYQASFHADYLSKAVELNAAMLEKFQDADGALFYTANEGEKLLARTKDFYDGALPSGNSVGAYNCIRLSRMTGDMELNKRAEEIISESASSAKQHPTGSALLLTAYAFASGRSQEIVLTAESPEDIGPFIDVLRKTYSPQTVLLFHPSGKNGDKIRSVASYIANQTPVKGKASAYVCEEFQCKAPVTDATEFEKLLK